MRNSHRTRRLARRVTAASAVVFAMLVSIGIAPAEAHDTSGASEALKGRTYDGHVADPSPGGVAMEAISGARCEDGIAAGVFPCHKVDLDAFVPLTDLDVTLVNDIWGWEDETTGMQIAIVGAFEGTVFLDVTDGQDPIHLGTLPPPPAVAENFGNFWGDIRVYENVAYIGSEAWNFPEIVAGDVTGGFGVQMVDLTQFRGVTEKVDVELAGRIDEIARSHNLSINVDTGRLYVLGSIFHDTPCAEDVVGSAVPIGSGGAVVYDLTGDPLDPDVIGCLDLEMYNHDVQCVVYDGPDADYTGREICVGSNGRAVRVYDATDMDDVRVLATLEYLDVDFSGDTSDGLFPGFPAYYTHQGWFSEDHTFFFLGDELDEGQQGIPRTTYIWDFTDLDSPQLVSNFSDGNTSIDHNMFVLEGLLYQANYTAGLTIYDAWKADKGGLTQRGYFDTFPVDDRTDWIGAWGAYSFFGDGKVVVTSIYEGVFVLDSRAKSSNNQFAPGRNR